MASDVGRHIVNLLEKLESIPFRVIVSKSSSKDTVLLFDVHQKGNFYHFTNEPQHWYLREQFKVIKNDNFEFLVEIFLSNYLITNCDYDLKCVNNIFTFDYKCRNIDYKQISQEITKYSKIVNMVQRI
jgi:hypothetical protein